MKRIIKANANKPTDSIRTYRNNRNPNKYIEVKKGNDGHSYMRQYMKWDTDNGEVKNYTGARTSRGRYFRSRQATIDQALDDYTEITSGEEFPRGYAAPRGPEDDADIDFAASRIADYLTHNGVNPITTESIIESFRNLCDDYDDWWARGLRTREQEKAFVDKLLAALAKYGITDVVDNTFDNVTSCSNTIQASYSPALLDDLIAEYEDYDLDLVWDFVMEKFDDEDLANDVVDGVEARQRSMGIRSSQDITASSLVTSGCSFDFTWEDDYDMQDIESAVARAFESAGVTLLGIDFYSVDYSQYPEYADCNVSQCGADFEWKDDYSPDVIRDAVETEMASIGYPVVGIDFYTI